MNPNNRYKQLYCLSAIELLLLGILQFAAGDPPSDSVTYFAAWDKIINGQPDSLRTPVYPLFVGSMRALFGSLGGLIAVITLQSALFVCSIGWMRSLLSHLIDNRRIVFCMTCVYALYPGPLTLCGVVLTEALALAGMTGLLLLSLRAYKTGSQRDIILTGILMLSMVFLRPALIYLPPCFALLWIVVLCIDRAARQIAAIGLAGCMISIVALAAYSIEIHRLYGFNGPSSVSTINNYHTARGAGALVPAEISDPRLRAAIDSVSALHPVPDVEQMWSEIPAITAVCHTNLLAEQINSSIKAHPVEVAKYIIMKRINMLLESDCVYGGNILPAIRALTKPVSPNTGAAILLLLICASILLRHDRLTRSFSLFPWFLCGLFITAYATVLIGAPGEWPRLLIPNYPVLLAVIALSFGTKIPAHRHREDANAPNAVQE